MGEEERRRKGKLGGEPLFEWMSRQAMEMDMEYAFRMTGFCYDKWVCRRQQRPQWTGRKKPQKKELKSLNNKRERSRSIVPECINKLQL